mmetsp:Transcript_9344/g.14121  ORF Transcript_9344/g.14121 Transcript_9344/m.14121 type:complete len:321 (+) Transcript_9344:1090-2052(+)|eukprot:CAMPEP_0170505942 /NCGR_PEP_ID=MMETSP0208-20121228/52916_1 /TAXON_ID=197538 /ORGANISM="Strombidium inclinatum, Strain S3" /LENGTH=320 /DNA_ID=CAMNT_0010787137 /DNA_START=1015 /DNA_END=1977 /DNA_ORIENTATION=+
MTEIIEQAKRDMAISSKQKAKVLNWSALEKPDLKTLRKKSKEEEEARLRMFFIEHNSRSKPKKKVAKTQASILSSVSLKKEERLGSKVGTMLSSVLDMPKPKIAKKGTKFRHIDTHLETEEESIIKKGSTVIDGTFRMASKMESNMSLTSSPDKRGSRFQNRKHHDSPDSGSFGSDAMKLSLNLKQAYNKLPSSVSPARPPRSQFAKDFNEELKHKQTQRLKDTQTRVMDFLEHARVPTSKGTDTNLTHRRVERSLDVLQVVSQNRSNQANSLNNQTKDGSFRDSSFDSIDGNNSDLSKSNLSARLHKKGETIKEKNLNR